MRTGQGRHDEDDRDAGRKAAGQAHAHQHGAERLGPVVYDDEQVVEQGASMAVGMRSYSTVCEGLRLTGIKRNPLLLHTVTKRHRRVAVPEPSLRKLSSSRSIRSKEGKYVHQRLL